ncbi:MAG TPA: hypothetical protein VGF67_17065 [Ktedonobacteraceae bacterium]
MDQNSFTNAACTGVKSYRETSAEERTSLWLAGKAQQLLWSQRGRIPPLLWVIEQGYGPVGVTCFRHFCSVPPSLI